MVFAFDFSKIGTRDYTEAMWSILDEKITVFFSQRANEKVTYSKFVNVFSSRNFGVLLLQTFLYLPFVLTQLLFMTIRYRPKYFYFTSFHPWNIIVIYLGKLLRISSIITVHDAHIHPGDEKLFLSYFLKHQYTIADRHVFLTKHVKELLYSQLKSKQSCIIPHPILYDEVKHSLPLSAPLKILVLGRVRDYKGIELAIEVATQLRGQVYLSIIGEGATSRDNHGNINCVNRWVSKKEIKKAIQTHHVLLLPYTEASQSGILALGLGSGMPMIITDVGGLREQLDGQSAIVVQPESSELIKAVQRVIDDPKMYQSLKNEVDVHRQTESIKESFIRFINE